MKTFDELNYGDDARLWLTSLLRDRGAAVADNLAAAVDMAGGQLELLKRAVLDVPRYAGPVAMVPRGTVLIILANAKKVVTLHWTAMPAGAPTRQQQLDRFVTGARDEYKRDPTGIGALQTIDLTVRKFGAPVGKRAPRTFPPDGIMMVLGMLFGAMPDRHDIVAAAESVANREICPVMVGLIGPGSEQQTLCGAWPLLMPLAKYVEAATGAALKPFDAEPTFPR